METGLMGAFVFFIIIMFVTFLIIWRRLMAKRLDSATQHLDGISQDYLKKQEAAKKKMEEAEIVAQQTVSQAKEEALTMRKDIIENANDEKEKIIQAARTQSEDMIQQAEKTRHMLIAEIEKRIAVESTKKSSQLLASILSEDIRRQIHVYLIKTLLESGISDLKNLDIPDTDTKIKVSTAFALTDDDKKSLLKIIKKKTSKNTNVEETIDEKLIAGFMIKLGHLVLDGSLQHKIHEKAKEMVKEDHE